MSRDSEGGGGRLDWGGNACIMGVMPVSKPKTRLMARLMEDAKELAPKVGDVVTGVVITKEPRRIFLDLGSIGTGVIFGTEYIVARDQIKNLNVGDKVAAKILSLANEEGFVELSLKDAGKEETWNVLKKMKEERAIITTTVLEANRGGLIMEVNDVRGFLPVSQLSIKHYPRVEGGEKNKILEELKKFIGQEMKVRILDLNPKEEKLIFSEREAEEDSTRALLAKYEVGDSVEGEVTAIVPFGAFLRFGEPPLEGLIHISEIDYKLIDDPHKFLSIGQNVKAQIIGVENNRVSLSLKTLKQDPWEKVIEKYEKGKVYQGRVLKINPFGAFIELDPDIHGLCHVSQFGGLEKLKEAMVPGTTYQFEILVIEPKERRLSLGIPAKTPPEEIISPHF